MNGSTSGPDLFNRLADEFAERYRGGERPPLSEYADKYPELADEIRELFPALVAIEQFGNGADEASGPVSAQQEAARPIPERLGDYRIVRQIARGGMGIVYEAVQESLGRHVALKVLPQHRLSDPEQLERFRRESRAAAMLHHTNIVPVFEVGKDGEVSYYAMQFILGQGLDLVIDELRRLKERAHPTGPAREPQPPHRPISFGSTAPTQSRARPVSRISESLLTGRFVPATPGGSGEAEAASANREATAALSDHRDSDETDAPPASENPTADRASPPSSVVLPGGSQLSAVESGRRPFFRSVAHIGRQVATGLSYAHARGVVHRDIKPSNLLLDTQGVVWITDFGLAKANDDGLTQTGDILGTVRYMAPERFRGEGDGRADVYALGLTLYELLTLRPAFDSPDRLQLIEQIKTQDPGRPRALDPRIPRDLETIVLKAIAKDPQGRYPSADALAEDLRRFLADEPIRARRVGSLERVWIWAKRRPAAAALLLVSLVAAFALVGAGVAFFYNTRLEAKNAQLAKANEKAEFQRYFHHIARAAAGWREGNMAQVEELLDACPPDRRGWEWHYLKRLCHTDLLTLKGHSDAVHGVAYCPDGTRLASAGADGTVTVWDAITGQELLTLPGHTGVVYAVAYSPDRKTLASAGQDKTVRVWDAITGQLIRRLERFKYPVSTVAFSPDGRRLVSGDFESNVRVWDVMTGREVRFSPLKGHDEFVYSVAYSPDGRRLASACVGSFVLVWNATTGKKVFNLWGAASSGATAVAFSPDGRRLATGSQEGTVKLWDVATGQPLRNLSGHTSGVTSLAFSPDGRRLASSSQGGVIKIWDRDAISPEKPRPVVAPHSWPHSWQSSHEPLTLMGHTGSVNQVAFSPDGMQLASASTDGTIKVWDARSEPEARTFVGHTMAFSPDGKRLASSGWGEPFKVMDATTGQQIVSTFKGGVMGVAFSPDGKVIALESDETIRLWDIATGHDLRSFKGHTGGVNGVAFSPNGRSLASASWDHTVKLWDVATAREIHTFTGHTDTVWSVAFSPDGKRLASGSNDGSVRLWDVTTGKLIRTLPSATSLHTIAFSRDGTRLASATEDRTIRLWDVRTGEPIRQFVVNMATIAGLAFTPDGKRLASTSSDGTVKLWDVATGQEALVLRGHTSGGWGVAFSPDGTRLATGDEDCRGKLWDARPWTPEAAIEREAVGVLDSLFTRPLRRADVLDYLKISPTIRPRSRQLALSIVDGYHEEKDLKKYHEASWALVRQPYLNAFQYRFALLQAEHACRLAPDRKEYRICLGAALYRAGRYQEAVETLGKADRPDTGLGSPAALTFLAMSHHQLGQEKQARAVLARLRQVLDQLPGPKDAETLGLVYEAEALIAPPAAATKQ